MKIFYSNVIKRLTVVILSLLAFTFSVNADDLISFQLSSTLNSTTGYSTGTISTNAPNSGFQSNTFWTNGWNSGPYIYYQTSQFSTFGFYNIVANASQYSASNGPRDFALQYRIGASGSWVTARNYSITTTLLNYQTTLPAECNNQPELYLRWIATSYLSTTGGTIGATARNYIASVSITGDVPVVPNTQANSIRFVAITPTTIRTSCTPGNGDQRVIVINNVNSFTNPLNDSYPVANPVYGGTGQQVVYVGSGSNVNVVVPDAYNNYYFRVYDFKYNGGMTRFINTTAFDNPNLCALERIVANSATNIRLTRATLNATISPKKTTISDRGFVWSLTSGENFNYNNEYATYEEEDGAFSMNFADPTYGTTNLPRGSTIYFKAYVVNVSGKAYSNELSFSNVPVFSGTGNWETAARWNVQEVPGENGDPTYGSRYDNPIINGVATLTSQNRVNNLTINSGRVLTINSNVLLRVDNILSNNGGTNGLVLKASSTLPNASLIFDNPAANPNVPAAVEMYSKASVDLTKPAGSRFKWQFFGIPVRSLANYPTFGSAYVREWDESVTDYFDVWVRRNDGTPLQLGMASVLQPIKGYEVAQTAPITYTLRGNLFTDDLSFSLPYTSSAYFKGQSILSNPYLAAINIEDMYFGANTEATVYQYNTGTYNDWIDGAGISQPGSGPGTYIASTPASAGLPGIPTQIPSMQGFMVRATAHPGYVEFPYYALVKNTSPQRVPKSSNKIGMMIDLIGTTFSDRMWILVDDRCTPEFDNGFDGRKMLGFENASQIYGKATDGIYQIFALSDVNHATIAVQPGLESQLKLKFTHQNMDIKYPKLYLMDLKENTVVDISNNESEYIFTATANDSFDRFKIVSTTTNNNEQLHDNFMLSAVGSKLIVNNVFDSMVTLNVYDQIGRLCFTHNAYAGYSVVPTSLVAGTYIVKVNYGVDSITKRIIIK